jgi:hypothetical protein
MDGLARPQTFGAQVVTGGRNDARVGNEENEAVVCAENKWESRVGRRAPDEVGPESGEAVDGSGGPADGEGEDVVSQADAGTPEDAAEAEVEDAVTTSTQGAVVDGSGGPADGDGKNMV